MVDLDHLHRLIRAFTALLDDLPATWPRKDIDYVREEVGYDEYEDALENLIALGLQPGHGFTADQISQIEHLAAMMGLRESPWLDQLRESAEAQRKS